LSEVVFQSENDKAVLSVYYCEIESPREDENLGTFYTWQSRYNSPDKHSFSEPSDFLRDLAYDFMDKTDNLHNRTDESLMRLIERNAIILPVFKYEHGGVVYKTSRFSCQWDSGQVGWVYVTKEAIRKNWGTKLVTPKYREMARQALISEVACYSEWANGQVFRFVLEQKTANEDETVDLTVIDSQSGFLGSDFNSNGLLDEIDSEYKDLVLAL
jgi:hypothetical protein